MKLEERFLAMVRENDFLMSALLAARDVALPNWYIGAGVLRDFVWDRLHGRPPLPPRDIDVAFFDANDLSRDRDIDAQCALERRLGGVPWEAVNQAAVHLWYGEAFGTSASALTSCEAAIATWPETVTCVGIRLCVDDSIAICAPFGLEDLFGMIWRRNPARVTVDEFERRLARKHVHERWERVRIEREANAIR
jgi:hypothetical protein